MAVTFDHFSQIEIRVGTVVKAEAFSRAKNPSFKVWVDFGADVGIKQTSAQITEHYTPEALIGKQVVGVLNLGTRNIAGFMSEFLLTGFSDEDGAIILACPDKAVPNGGKLY